MPWRTFTILVLGCLASAAMAQKKDVRVGVYDSRAVAYAHFWSLPVQHQHAAIFARAKAAKAAGDVAQFDQLTARIRAEQKRSHFEVFSTAPAAEAMCALKEKLPAIQREAGIDRFVSKWDEDALSEIPAADRVDVTDRLVREFLPVPTERQRKTIEALRNAKPLPMWEARLISVFGGV